MRPLLIALFMLPAAAGADVEMRYSDGLIGLVSDGRVMFGDAENSVLFTPGDPGMIVLSRAERTWMRLEPGFADEMMAQMQARMDQMLAGMPPEQRAMVEQQMKSMMPQLNEAPPEMSIARTGAEDEVAGYDCEVAEIRFEDGSVDEVVCVATPDELGIADDDFEALMSAMQGMAEIASVNPNAAPVTDFGKLGGIPIRSRGADGGPSELVSIDTGSIDEARFAIPDNYREVSIADMMGN